MVENLNKVVWVLVIGGSMKRHVLFTCAASLDMPFQALFIPLFAINITTMDQQDFVLSIMHRHTSGFKSEGTTAPRCFPFQVLSSCHAIFIYSNNSGSAEPQFIKSFNVKQWVILKS